jgi:hypothetical protein
LKSDFVSRKQKIKRVKFTVFFTVFLFGGKTALFDLPKVDSKIQKSGHDFTIHREITYIKVANIATFFEKSCESRNSVSLLVDFLAKSCGSRNFFLKISLFF